MSDVQFFIPNFNPKNCRILCRQGNYNEIEFGIKTDKTDMVSCIDNISNRYIKLIPEGVYFILEIDKSNTIADVCRNIKISYDALLISDKDERCNKNDIIISDNLV
jgi:hypothetical protein